MAEATNRRGQSISCRVRLSRLAGSDGSTQGIIVLIDEESS
jgi:hypothetical protein